MLSLLIFLILLITVVIFLFHFSRTKNKSVATVIAIFLLAFLAANVFRVAQKIYTYYPQPPTWDFLGFWLNGTVAISGENFYNAENYREIVLPYDPGGEFREEIIDTGFWYPPFSMFLFLPLGLLDISKAYVLWQSVNLLLCAACIYGLWKSFLLEYNLLGLLLASTLLWGLEPTRLTFSFSQTNLLNLLFFLLFWQNRTKTWGGVWLAFCVVIKPYMAILYLYPLLTRKWKMLAIAVLTLLIFTFLSALAFGSDVFTSFMRNPVPETPIWNYTEVSNQSLLATILRSNQSHVTEESLVLNPLYLGISLVFTFITVLTTIRNKGDNQDWIILSILFLALIVYPANQMFYSVFLILPVALLLQQSDHNIKRRIVIFLIIFLTYFLSGYDSGSRMFYANLFMWLVCIVMAAKPSFEKADGSDSVMAPALSTDSVEPG